MNINDIQINLLKTIRRKCGFLASVINGSSNAIWFTMTSTSELQNKLKNTLKIYWKNK